MKDAVLVPLTKNEINRLSSMLRDSAQSKKRRAREVDLSSKQDIINSAMADYELRKKLIAAKMSVDLD